MSEIHFVSVTVSAALVMSVVLTSPAHAQRAINDLRPIERAYPFQGAYLGQGYDYVTGRFLPTICVTGGDEALPTQSASANYKLLEDKETLFESMKLSAEGSYDAGAASASIKAEYAKSVTIDHVRRNVLANIESMNGGKQLIPAASKASLLINTLLANEIANDTKAGSTTAKFRAKCGDGFVAAIRHGVRYHLVFSYKLDAEEIQESLKVEASGKYGAAKAKASMERIKTKKGSAAQTEVSYLSDGGGKKELPIDAAGAIEWIKTSVNVGKDDVSPLEVVVMPYSTIPDFSEKLRSRALPSADMQYLGSHYWRIVDLLGLYTAAVNAPASYYRPFMTPQQVSDSADALRSAAFCIPEILNYCAATGKCQSDDIERWAKSEKPEYCRAAIPGGSESEEQAQRKTEVARLIFGTQYLRRVANIAAANSVSPPFSVQGLKALQPVTAAPLIAAAAANEAADKKSPFVSALIVADKADEPWDSSPYDVYLQFLVRAPLKRDWTDNKQGLKPSDEVQLIIDYCKGQDLACGSLTYPAFSQNSPNADTVKLINEAVAMYLARVKLASISNAMCDIELSHPLCLTPNQLIGYVQDGNNFRNVRNGNAGAFVALVTPQAPAKPPRKEPPPPRCGAKPSGAACPPT
ncbi:hypothetical protein [Polaromonas sp. JS666]|uniref:hypothetical protein n=1 Tax=Polaromonas sp. (strain JS666 / ATCC BAA-500) TaxID=296591 RepID=UPI000053376B|nr:hypothetical protein [Polaromonas sp. JS666]ABE46846.1 hypothetical protein Bpro_4974 [Polaromonas sp. JS666]